ncbi:MAG TPA: GTP cyclohydrolase II [Kofleriaceae bacterium]|nr:GTP cyclohydrolase II [Kofleriaceae bacterium]
MSVRRYSEARLPTDHGEFRLVIYRTGEAAGSGASAVGMGAEEHVAMVMGDVSGGQDVLCRVHSSCFTGEVLGSLRCDCRAQLDEAMAKIAEVGRGVIVYLVQEGRGIGLGNKVRAYDLQDRGADTVDANLQLGFDADLRSYDLAAAMLRDLDVASVRLLTNNPKKLEGLRQAGTVVVGHERHWVESSAHSEAYLAVKRKKLGHIS